ncbi:hypothetical protein CUC08_Gglean013476 [Alternaria sp. MG1]|nr:hypothetical protein CUC08_Gglean013476 [Alternaria sp. MG1]
MNHSEHTSATWSELQHFVDSSTVRHDLHTTNFAHPNILDTIPTEPSRTPYSMDSKRRKTGDQDISALRLASRQKYLAEREAQQLALLRRQVAEEAEEEERLGDKLSARERQEFRNNKKTLELAEARNAIDDSGEGYILPDADYSNKHEALTKRHKDKVYEKSEVQLWEEEQMKKIKSQPKPKASDRVQEEDYEYVFDTSNEVQFQVDASTRVDVDKQMLQRQLDEAEKRASSIEDVRRSLPVYKFRDELLAAVDQHQVIVVVGETGSGKSTQIPQYVHSALDSSGMIAVTQPRRVAAMSVAKRVAEEFGCKLGNEVGYSIRFEDKTGPKTKIKFATDGVLLQEAKSDPLLSNYSCIMIDEAHERSLQSDLLLVLCREVCHARPDFKLLILSATINAAHFSQYFHNCPIFSIPGRTFPVEVLYSKAPEANYLAASITTVMQIHISAEPKGDILVFLTGEEEILAAAESIEETKKKLGSRIRELVVCPIYSALPQDLQQKAFEPAPPNGRKVILATNIAETSVTFEGVRHVVDTGYSKENTWDSVRGLSSLVITPISRANADQRKGRAGRTSSGWCYRLYTRAAYYNELQPENIPEIQRTNLDEVVLSLKQLGITNLLEFEFLDSPSSTSMIKSLENLYALGALDSTGALTRLGRRMAELPLDIKLSKAIIESEKYGCREEILSIVSMTGESATLFLRPKDKKVAADAARKRFTSLEGGDFITYLNIWNEFVESGYDPGWARENYLQGRVLTRVRDVRDQLERLADRVEVPESSCGTDHIAIRKCLTAAFFTNAARLQRDGQTYRVLANSGLTVHIHPSSPLNESRPKWCIFASLQATSKEWMMTCAPIEPDWLVEVAPHMHTESSISKLGDNKKMPKALQERSKTSAGHNMTIKSGMPMGQK